MQLEKDIYSDYELFSLDREISLTDYLLLRQAAYQEEEKRKPTYQEEDEDFLKKQKTKSYFTKIIHNFRKIDTDTFAKVIIMTIGVFTVALFIAFIFSEPSPRHHEDLDFNPVKVPPSYSYTPDLNTTRSSRFIHFSQLDDIENHLIKIEKRLDEMNNKLNEE